MPRSLLSLLIVCLCAADAWAADTKSPVAELVKTLSSKDADQANMARDKLISLGATAVEELESHQSDDEKVVVRIKYILNRICNYYIRIDPKREKDISSPGGNGIQVMMSIKNNTKHTVKLHWLDRSGNRLPYKDIKPGDEIQQRSFEGHVWIIVDKDAKALGLYRSTYQNGRILVDQKFF